jgi:fucose 4-O-acetylase-like acetyltransferase
MKAGTKVETRSRLSYLDNLRIGLTILVILHHTAIAYGGTGGWGVKDPAVDPISPIFLTIFNALNQSYFMTAFFLVSGYFAPRSYDRKGARSFLSSRLVRFGIPILIYTTLVININGFIINTLGQGLPFRFRVGYDPGHLWFLQLLLIFTVIYAIARSWAGLKEVRPAWQSRGSAFPPDRILALTIVALALLTFVARVISPVGETIIGMQPGHMVHYAFAYFAGIVAYRNDWFQTLSNAQGRRWGKIALGVFPSLFVLMILGGALESDENVLLYLGGFSWQSFVYSVWETIMMIGVILFLLYYFRERFNRSVPWSKWAAASTFTVYIVHQTILYALNVWFLPVAIPTIVKFMLVPAIAIPVCFLLSIPMRRLPYAGRVLG